MKKIFLLAGIFVLLSAITIQAQVTIGKMIPPDSSAVLQVISPDSTKGVLVPEMTVDQRDLIKNQADGLLIYNISEECYNYWNATDGSWQSLCGGVAKAVYTVACSDITVNGMYVQGSGLNGNDYLAIKANVTKAGSYTITGTTPNGYGFTTQGTFLNTGMQTVLVPGQGQPVAANQTPGDPLTVSLSGADSNCNGITIPVLPPTANFTLSCGTAKFNGVYVKGHALDATNTVTFNVNVSDISAGGSWAVTSNMVNGISFAGSGLFTNTGPQTVTLKGTGTPTGTDPITLTFTTNSGDGSATCTATVNVAIPPMTVLGLGSADGYDYSVFGNPAADNYRMAMSTNNFGTLPTSTVKFGDGTTTWKIDPNSGPAASPATVVSKLNSSTPPDIVVIGYGWDDDAAGDVSAALTTYLKKGGVVLMFCEQANLNTNIFTDLYGSGVTSAPNGCGSGARYQFPSMNNDPVINGPFGNLGGAYWGEDASVTSTVSGLPASVTVYTIESTSANAAGTPTGGPGGAGQVTAFRDNTYSFIWVGDGGFNSDVNHTSTTICPFYVSQSGGYIPMAKAVQYWDGGGCSTTGAGPVSNSIFTANALAWALNKAMTSGINPH